MAVVKIECPETGDEVCTGVDVPPDHVPSNRAADHRTDCPFCGRTHSWADVPIVSDHRTPGDEDLP